MTEVDINDAVQRAELFNSGPAAEDLTGWSLQTPSGGAFPLSGVINAGQHRVFTLPTSAVPLIRNRGDCLELFDANLDALVDRVLFGDTGGAPLDIQSNPGSSLARATGSADPSGIGSPTAWTVDFTSTFGAANNAPVPNFLPMIKINELVPQGLNVLAELHNTTAGAISLAGYRLSTGQDSLLLSGSIAGGGFAVFNITGLAFDFSLNLYLFRSDEVRIDQLGLSDSPGDMTTWNDVITDGQSLGRFPDGAGPGVGFDLGSSGFPKSLQRMPPTPGTANIGQPTGGGSAVPLSRGAMLATAFLLIALAARSVAARNRWRSGLAGPGETE